MSDAAILPSYHTGFAPRDGAPLYPSLQQGRIGSWGPSLGNTGAQLQDHSGRTNNGVLVNSFWGFDQGDVITIDNPNKYVAVGASSLFSFVPQLTCSFWAKFTDVASQFRCPVINSNEKFIGLRCLWLGNEMAALGLHDTAGLFHFNSDSEVCHNGRSSRGTGILPCQ